MGVPVNFTYESKLVNREYGLDPLNPRNGTGDSVRQGGVPDLQYALHSGIKVAMLYGDRDYVCPWNSAETIANTVSWPGQKNFTAAGYAKLVTNQTYDGGVVKQFEGLSFTRVFDAGHEVGKYQTETVYRVFMRSMFGMDTATGTVEVGLGFQSKGSSSAWSKSKVPILPRTCVVGGQSQEISVWEGIWNGTSNGY